VIMLHAVASVVQHLRAPANFVKFLHSARPLDPEPAPTKPSASSFATDPYLAKPVPQCEPKPSKPGPRTSATPPSALSSVISP